MGVFFLALEDNERRLKTRFDKLKGLGSDNLKFIVNVERNKPGIMAIAERIKKHPETRMVVIDTLGQFLPEFDFNAYGEAQEALQGLKTIASPLGASCGFTCRMQSTSR